MGDGVAEGVGVLVGAGVDVAVGAGVGVDVGVLVGVGSWVGTTVAVGSGVDVGVGLGSSEQPSSSIASTATHANKPIGIDLDTFATLRSIRSSMIASILGLYMTCYKVRSYLIRAVLLYLSDGVRIYLVSSALRRTLRYWRFGSCRTRHSIRHQIPAGRPTIRIRTTCATT